VIAVGLDFELLANTNFICWLERRGGEAGKGDKTGCSNRAIVMHRQKAKTMHSALWPISVMTAKHGK